MSKYTYCLKSVASNGLAFGGFIWPEKGLVTAPDWLPNTECGNGLHAFARGEGRGKLAKMLPTAKWLVLKVETKSIIDLKGKVKFPQCEVIYCGTRDKATQYILKRYPEAAVIGITLTGGEGATLKGGDYATLTGGHRSTLTGGHYATIAGGRFSSLTGGEYSTLTGGDYSTLTGGEGATLTGGYGSILKGGYGSTLTGGHRSTLTGGDYSTLTGGEGATLTGGDYSTLTGGRGSILTGGEGATLVFRVRNIVATVGQDNVRPNTPYRVVNNALVEVKK